MTFVRKGKFWAWLIAGLLIVAPLVVGGGTHFTKQSGVSSADDLTTTELDTTLHLTPDGAEGVEWTAPVAPVAEELTTVEVDSTKRLAPDGAGGVVWGAASTITGGGAVIVASIAGLRAFEPDGISDPEIVILAGWTTVKDGGEGTFQWDSTSTAADDSCIIIKPATAATGRWIRVAEKDTLSVLWCGDTSSSIAGPFNLAVAAAEIHGIDTVHIPAGSYNTAGRLNIISRTGLVIDGYDATITQDTDETITFLVNSSSDITIQGVSLIGKRTDYTAAATEAVGIWIDVSSDVVVKECDFKWHAYAAIQFKNSSDIRVQDNDIEGTDDRVADERFEFCIKGAGDGLTYKNIYFLDNYCFNSGTGFFLQSDLINVHILGNTIENMEAEHGMYLTGLSNSHISHNTIINFVYEGIKNQIDGPTVTFQASDNNEYIGNTIKGGTSWGIGLGYVNTPGVGIEHTRSIVSGNVVSDTGGGITVRRFADATLTGNFVYNSTGAAGYFFSEGGSAWINSNQVDGCDREGYYSSIDSGDTHYYKSNFVKNAARTNPAAAQYGFNAVGDGDVEYKNNTMEQGASGLVLYPIGAISNVQVTMYDNILDTSLFTRVNNIVSAGGNIHGSWFSYPTGTLRTGHARARHYTDSAPPVSGSYYVGDIFWNDVPAAGGNIGWVNITTGTPGTWKSFGTIAP